MFLKLGTEIPPGFTEFIFSLKLDAHIRPSFPTFPMSHPHRRVSYNPCPAGPNESLDRRPRNNVNGGGHGLPKLMGGLFLVDARSGWRCKLLRGGKWPIFLSGISSGASKSHPPHGLRQGAGAGGTCRDVGDPDRDAVAQGRPTQG